MFNVSQGGCQGSGIILYICPNHLESIRVTGKFHRKMSFLLLSGKWRPTPLRTGEFPIWRPWTHELEVQKRCLSQLKLARPTGIVQSLNITWSENYNMNANHICICQDGRHRYHKHSEIQYLFITYILELYTNGLSLANNFRMINIEKFSVKTPSYLHISKIAALPRS